MFKNLFSELVFKGVQEYPGVPLIAKLVQASTIISLTALSLEGRGNSVPNTGSNKYIRSSAWLTPIGWGIP